MSKEYLKTYVNAGVAVLSSPNGTARLLSGYKTLKNAADAGVSPSQMQAIFPDLRPFTEAQIEGFVTVASSMVNGETIIADTLFSEPNKKNVVTA